MFHLSTKFRYGLRALIELAVQSKGNPVSLGVLASKQDISQKYLESIFKAFHKTGIVRSVRGPKGGYMLAESPKDLIILSIFKALEGSLDIIECLHDKSVCTRTAGCSTRELWKGLEESIETFLSSRTLQDLMENYQSSKHNFKAMNI